MTSPIRLAISTCPNDTFAFHAILNQKIDLQGLDFQIELLDIQQLNRGLMANRFDVAKASFHAAMLLSEKMVVLSSGSALGFGVGPLLLAAADGTSPADTNENAPWLTLCPGELTTATLLYKLFYGSTLGNKTAQLQQVVFSEIMPALQRGAANFGVCIHEGRFTWRQAGLSLVEDLGARWETETESPLPLGGIIASRKLPANTIDQVQSLIRKSIQYGLEHRDETLPTMRQYAQEFGDDVLMQHVDLYVNEWTLELGDVGKNALQQLTTRAQQASLVPASSPGLEVWG